MKQSTRVWLFALTTLIFGSATCVAQSRIQLVQGRRTVTDKVTFVVEVGREKNENPRYANAPEDMYIVAQFTRATGMFYLDGKALGRFDESGVFNSNPVDITYGRHVITLTFANPTVVTGLYVLIRGGVAREILEGESIAFAHATGLEHRIVELERKVKDLESQIATLKKKP
jgi:hypothetical protein